VSDEQSHAICDLCGERLGLGEVIRHLKEQHPVEFEFANEGKDGFDTWPDGEPVIIDETLEPDDFKDG
jgi:hypothetical protein